MSTLNLCTSNLGTDFGTLPYMEALNIQKHFHRSVVEGNLGRFLMILEHPPTYTGGRKTLETSLQGIQVIRTDRGGDVTYHGPGQLVLYPIFPVGTEKIDVRMFVKDIENVVILTLKDLGFTPYIGEEPGIWVSENGGKKVCSIGMAIDHGVSYHGVAINYSDDAVMGFQSIRPCGMDPSVMGSLRVTRDRLKDAVLKNFDSSFGMFKIVDPSDALSMFSYPARA
ncbi:MAG: lipoyl(octanoyl) transferase LipB [Candidatus Thermoplasmatota archaeon]|nr:lipoyl(octanoyl) transferase LipB [Candidatus Thermoplasmatota archaeon]